MEDLFRDKLTWWSPYAVPQGPLAPFASDLAGELDSFASRRRKRRADDEAAYLTCVSALVANMAGSILDGTPRFAVKLSTGGKRSSRYDHPVITPSMLRSTADLFQAAALMEVSEGGLMPGIGYVASTIAPTPALRERLATALSQLDASTPPIAESVGRETILLGVKTTSYGPGGSTVTRELAEYDDDDASHSMRLEMERINSAIAAFDLSLDGRPLIRRHMARSFRKVASQHPDGSARHEGGAVSPWAYGGRLFGGEWENVRKSLRRGTLLIGTERTGEADMNACHLRIALASHGEPVRADIADAYEPLRAFPDRGLLKQSISAILGRSHASLRKAPQGFPDKLPSGWTWLRLTELITATYPALTSALQASGSIPLALRLQRTEADVIVRALLDCHAHGIAALPLHDALITPASQVQDAATILRRASKQVSGCELPVSTTTSASFISDQEGEESSEMEHLSFAGCDA
jgi:hypothetical protein